MNKFVKLTAATLLAATMCAGFAACTDNSQGGNGGGNGDNTDDVKQLTVFAPDGAPALAVAGLSLNAATLSAQSVSSVQFDVNVVDANTINTYVTGNSPAADIAVMPVNAAVKALGTGASYKLIGTVTHGNLYLMKKQGGTDITSANISSLVGKTVGVINLASVPGLTFKAILSDNELEFNELKDGASPVADKVNLLAIEATQAIPSNASCDYFVVPEPAASTKQSATGGKLSFAGDLQELYEGGEGYPQAVAVAKTSVTSAQISAFIDGLEYTEDWLMDEDTTAESIVTTVNSLMYKADMVSSLTAANLTKTVIENSAIGFVPASQCKADILEYMSKINAVSATSFGTPSDEFFYNV